MNQARKIVVEDAPPAAPVRPGLASWYTPGFSDALGDRLLMFDNTTAASLELLRFKPEFGDRPAFEHALRQRLKQFEHFSHPAVARVRSVDWLGDGEGLALISNHVSGRRLSEVVGEVRGPSFAVELLRQLVPALAALQQHGGGVAHGALNADRIVVTPQGRLVIVEHVLGTALEQLHLPAGRLQAELGILVPSGQDSLSLDARTDVLQLASVALALLIGRSIDPAHCPEKGAELLDEFSWPIRRSSVATPRLRGWLERALQLNGRTFTSAQDAHRALMDLPDDQELHMAGQPRTFRALAAADSQAASPIVLTPEPPDFLSEHDTDRSSSIDAPAAGHAPVPDLRRPNWLTDAGRQIQADSPGQPEPAVSTPNAARARRAISTYQWIIAALVVLALTEGFAIGGLLYGQRATPPPVAPPAGTIAAAPVTPDARPAILRESNQELREGLAAAGLPPGTAASQLEVASDPPGAKVTVDGKARGATPVVLALAPGAHIVVVSDGNSTTTRTMNTVAGGTATLLAALSPAGSAAGWLSISVPIELQVREAGSLIGITTADRLMLPAGHHELEVVNAALGFQKPLAVDIQPGKTVKVTVPVPNGSLSINALPWANVWIDGQPLAGTTPFANVAVALGPHEILYKHPQLGERRQSVVVTMATPVRVVMDLKK